MRNFFDLLQTYTQLRNLVITRFCNYVTTLALTPPGNPRHQGGIPEKKGNLKVWQPLCSFSVGF
jgi:hypothetical protein